MDSTLVFSGGPLDGQTRTVNVLPLPPRMEVEATSDEPAYRDVSEIVKRPVRLTYNRGKKLDDSSWQYNLEVRS